MTTQTPLRYASGRRLNAHLDVGLLPTVEARIQRRWEEDTLVERRGGTGCACCYELGPESCPTHGS